MLSVACKNDNFAFLHFSNYQPFTPLIHIFHSFSDHNSDNVRDNSVLLGRITEQGEGKVSHAIMTTLIVLFSD